MIAIAFTLFFLAMALNGHAPVLTLVALGGGVYFMKTGLT